MKGVGNGVYERVIDFGPGYRVYFGKDGDKVVILLAGGTKKRQDIDITKAKERWQDYIETFLSGDAETGKAILRDYINATVGFGTLGKAIDIDPKSLMRMLGPSGNPKTDNFVEIINYLQTREGVHLKVEAAIA